MNSIRTLPLWALAVVLFLILAGCWYGIGLVVIPDQPIFVRLAGTAFYATAMTIFLTALVARARRRAGGVSELVRMQKAFREGEVPDEVDLSVWTAAVEAQHLQLRRTLWMAPVVFGASIALSAWLAIIQGPIWWAGAAFFGVVLVASLVSTPRGLEKVARMRADLVQRGGQDSAAPDQSAP